MQSDREWRATRLVGRRYTRRAMLGMGGGAALTGLLAACGGEERAKVVVEYSTATPAGPSATTTTSPTPIPPPDVLISTMEPNQGGTMLVSVVGGIRDGEIRFLERTFPLTRGQQSLYSFVGVDADDPAGEHPLEIGFTLASGSTGSIREVVRVVATEWTLDDVTLPPDQTNLLDPVLAEQEVELLKGVYERRTPEKLWGLGWRMPIEGPITTRFGEERSYNGGPASGHHGGTDIGAEEGMPVGACNSGRVAMARQLRMRGNMVAVDHGGGLYSGYAHLSEFSVAEGQIVGPGDVLGLVGNTGLSTGAHLHWEMAAGGVLVDALRFVDGTNGF